VVNGAYFFADVKYQAEYAAKDTHSGGNSRLKRGVIVSNISIHDPLF